jgi:UV excision repair protein RAD23
LISLLFSLHSLSIDF